AAFFRSSAATDARLAGEHEHRLAADRLGREPGQLHAEFGLGDALQRAAQPCSAPALELAAIAVLLLEEDRRPGGADRVLDRAAAGDSGREEMEPLEMA